MSGGYYQNSNLRHTQGRYDSYYDRDADLRAPRGRGGYRGSRPHEHYNNSYGNNAPRGRGRGLSYGRQDRYNGGRRDGRDAPRGSYRESYRDSNRDSNRDSYRDSYRDSNRDSYRDSYRDSNRDLNRDSHRDSHRDSYHGTDRDVSPRASPREASYRDHGSQEYPSFRDSGRDTRPRVDSFATRSDFPEPTRGEGPHDQLTRAAEPSFATSVDSQVRTEKRDMERMPEQVIERASERASERPWTSVRGPSHGNIYGHKRSSDAGHGPHRGSGGITPVSPAVKNGVSTLDTATRKPTVPVYANPWVPLLKLGEGKTAARLELNYKELSSVNDKLAELQSEKIKLTCALATLEVYAQRDALNTEICSEKLDEFTYL